MKIVLTEAEYQSTPGHVLLASQLGFPDKQKYYDSLWNFLNQPGHAQYVGNMVGPEQNIINTVAQRCIRSWGHYADSLMGLQNIFQNLNKIKQNSQVCFEKGFKRAIWAPTGPSLGSGLPQIKEAQEKGYYVACADASLIHFIRAGFLPNMVFTTERGPETLDLFKVAIEAARGLNVDLSNVWLNRSIYSQPGLTDLWEGAGGKTTWHFRKQSEVYYLFPSLRDKKEQICWATPHVASPAWSWLLNRGFSEIILIGQDLAYGPEGEVHSKGSHKDEWLASLDRFEVEANDGSKVYSNSYWAEWAMDLSNLICDYKLRYQFDIINTAHKGIKIKDTLYAPNGITYNHGPAALERIEKGVEPGDLKLMLSDLKRYNPDYIGFKDIQDFYRMNATILFLGFPLTVQKYCMYQMDRYRKSVTGVGSGGSLRELQAHFNMAKRDLKSLLTKAIKSS